MIIDEIDFSRLYRNHIELTHRKSKPASAWDERAQSACRTCGDVDDPYVIEFLSHVQTQGAKTLLDIGCGPGTITLPLANEFQHVYALDYSAGMLDVVKARAKAQNIPNVTCLQHSWDESGDQAWKDVPQCDIVVCSRASMVNDMGDALHKICTKAKQRAYVTMTVDRHLLPVDIQNCMSRQVIGFPNYIYAVNILYQMGYLPQVQYIHAPDCKSKQVTTNFEGFLKDIRWTVGELRDEEVDHLYEYFQAHHDVAQALKPQRRTWAMLSWEM